jgi:hypothetical protein
MVLTRRGAQYSPPLFPRRGARAASSTSAHGSPRRSALAVTAATRGVGPAASGTPPSSRVPRVGTAHRETNGRSVHGRSGRTRAGRANRAPAGSSGRRRAFVAKETVWQMPASTTRPQPSSSMLPRRITLSPTRRPLAACLLVSGPSSKPLARAHGVFGLRPRSSSCRNHRCKASCTASASSIPRLLARVYRADAPRLFASWLRCGARQTAGPNLAVHILLPQKALPRLPGPKRYLSTGRS